MIRPSCTLLFAPSAPHIPVPIFSYRVSHAGDRPLPLAWSWEHGRKRGDMGGAEVAKSGTNSHPHSCPPVLPTYSRVHVGSAGIGGTGTAVGQGKTTVIVSGGAATGIAE